MQATGAKIVLLSMLRAGPMTSTEMMDRLTNIGLGVSRIRVHKIISDLKKANAVSVENEARQTKGGRSSSAMKSVMVITVSQFGIDQVMTYLNSEIGHTIEDLKERVAATITDEDKALLVGNLFTLESSVDKAIRDSIAKEDELECSKRKFINSLDTVELQCLETACINARRWLDVC